MYRFLKIVLVQRCLATAVSSAKVNTDRKLTDRPDDAAAAIHDNGDPDQLMPLSVASQFIVQYFPQ